jgi:hypothetical protein
MTSWMPQKKEAYRKFRDLFKSGFKIEELGKTHTWCPCGVFEDWDFTALIHFDSK